MKVCFPPRAFSPVGPEVEVTQHMFALELMARRLTLTVNGSPSSVPSVGFERVSEGKT